MKSNLLRKKISILSAFFITLNSLIAYEARELIPPKADFVLHFNNVDTFKKEFDKTCIGKMLQDPKFKKFANGFHLANFFGRGGSDETKELLKQQLNLFQGEFFLAELSKPGTIGTNYSFFSISEENSEKYTALEKKLFKARKEECEFRDCEFRGVTIHAVDGESYNGLKYTNYHAWVNGYVIDSLNDLEWVEKTIAKVTKEAPTPPKKANQASITLKIDSWLNPLVNYLKPLCENKSIKTSKLKKILGLSDFNTLRLNLEPSEKSMKTIASLTSIPDDKSGIWSLLDMRPAPKNIRLPYVPKQIIAYSVYRLSLRKLCDKLPKLLQELNPGIWMKISGTLTVLQGQLGMNLYESLVIPLGDNLLSFSLLQDNKPLVLTGIPLKDSHKFEESLNKLANATGAQGSISPITTEKFLNYNLYGLKNQMMNTVSNPQNSLDKNKFMVAADTLFLGNTDLVRQTARTLNSQAKNGAREFYQSPFYQQSISRTPDDAIFYQFNNVKANITNVLKLVEKANSLRGGVNKKQLKASNEESLKVVFSEVNYERKPTIEDLTKFFGESILSARIANNALRLKLELFKPRDTE